MLSAIAREVICLAKNIKKEHSECNNEFLCSSMIYELVRRYNQAGKDRNIEFTDVEIIGDDSQSGGVHYVCALIWSLKATLYMVAKYEDIGDEYQTETYLVSLFTTSEPSNCDHGRLTVDPTKNLFEIQ